MKVEIWSDVVCPWCYIGKRRFEAALAQFEQRDQVEVVWRSFQLDPTAPRSAEKTLDELLSKKYGMTLKQASETRQGVSEVAAKEGLDYQLDKAQSGNTFDAHRLIHLAATHALQDAMKERLMKAYFTEGLPIGNIETLVKLGSEIGLDSAEVRTVLESDAYAAAVVADEQEARSLGIRGVPFFVFDEKYGVSGAQPSDLILTVLERTWTETHPLVLVTAEGEAGAVCNDESCAV